MHQQSTRCTICKASAKYCVPWLHGSQSMMAVQCHNHPHAITVACAEMKVCDKQSPVPEETVSRVWWAFLQCPNNETRTVPHIAEHLEMNGYKVEITKIVNGLIILNMSHLLWHNYKKKILERATFPKSVAIQRKNLFYHFRYNKPTKCVQLEHRKTSRNKYAHLEVTQEDGSSRRSSNFVQHMPGKSLRSDTDYRHKNFSWHASVTPAKCHGSAIN
jgi:hypothetical protein